MCLYLSTSHCFFCILAPDPTEIHASSSLKEQVTTKNTFTLLTGCIPLWKENIVMTWHIFSHLVEGRHYRICWVSQPKEVSGHVQRILFFSQSSRSYSSRAQCHFCSSYNRATFKKKLFAMSHVTLCCYFCLVSQTPAWIMLNPRHHFSPRLNWGVGVLC